MDGGSFISICSLGYLGGPFQDVIYFFDGVSLFGEGSFKYTTKPMIYLIHSDDIFIL